MLQSKSVAQSCNTEALVRCPELSEVASLGVEPLKVVLAKTAAAYRECKAKHDTLIDCVERESPPQKKKKR